MDWSSDIIKNLYNNVYKNNLNKDYNGDGKVDSKDKEKLFESSEYFKFKELTYEDLISFSNTKKDDVDENGVTLDSEKSFLSDLKNFLYENIARNINRKADLSLEDLLKLEETVRDFNETQKTDIGKELERVQNRMISNLTSQFFVTGETTQSYKDATVDKYALDVWTNLEALSDLNESKNNPFNAKTETLLEKLDKKVIKTLSESYSAESIQEFKKTGDKSKLEEKTDSPVEHEESDDVDELKDCRDPYYEAFDIGTDKYTWKQNANGSIIYLCKNDELFTGKVKYHDNDMYFENGRGYTGEHDGIYYNGGLIYTGVAKNGKYYKDGKPVTGDFPFGIGTLHVENGEIKYQDVINKDGNIERTMFITYEHFDENGKKVDTTFSKIITFAGTNTECIKSAVNYKDGEKVSTETYVYNTEDATYTVTITDEKTGAKTTETRDKEGNVLDPLKDYCYFNGMLYEKGKVSTKTTEYNGKYFVHGILAEGFCKLPDEDTALLFVKGKKYTGINKADNLYYDEGKIKSAVTDADGKLYIMGVLAQGICTYNGETKYYENGKSVESVKPSVISLVKDKISDVVIKIKDGKTVVTGKSLLQGILRDVTCDITLDANDEVTGFGVTYDLANGVTQVDTYSKTGENILLTEAKYVLKGKTENKDVVIENIDGAQNEDRIDYSISFGDGDGEVSGLVTVLQAVSDNVTKVLVYAKNDDGNYALVSDQTAFSSINDIQAGKSYNIFDSSKINKCSDDSYKVAKNFGDNCEIEFIYTADGIFDSAKIKFKNIEEILIEGNDSFSIDEIKKQIIVAKDNTITIYDENGVVISKIDNITENLKALANNLDIDLTKVTNFEKDGDERIISITFGGISYEVEYEGDTITLSNKIRKLKSVYKEISGGKYVLISKEEPVIAEETQEITGLKVKTWNESGALIAEEIKNNNGDVTDIFEYENGRLKQETKIDTENDKTTVIVPTYDAKGNITQTVVTVTDENTEVETVYIGNKQQPIQETLTYKKETVQYGETIEANTVETTWFDNDGKRAYTEVRDADNTLTHVKSYNYTSDSNNLLNTVIYKLDAGENIVYPVKIVNIAGGYALQDEYGSYTYYNKNGKEYVPSETLKTFVNSLGVLISELVFNDDDEVIGIKGVRCDNKPVVYENYSLSEENDYIMYNYTEILTLSTNATSDTTDDIILKTFVKKNKQESAEITVNGIRYSIYTDKATAEDKLDYAISTMEADDCAHIIYVYDVLFDGVSRQRTFKRNNQNGYSVSEVIALAMIETLKDNNKMYITLEAEEIEEADGTITLMNDDGKIIVNYGKYTQSDASHSAGDYKKAYEIALPQGVTTLTVKPKTSGGYEIKDSSGAIYEFTSNGGYKVTQNGVTKKYDKEGKLINS